MDRAKTNILPVGEIDFEWRAHWCHYIFCTVLLIVGAILAGSTIALVGQDALHLEVISRDTQDPQRNHAMRVLGLMKERKYWVLVTCLTVNAIANETIPIILETCLNGSLTTILSSTVIILVFGEIIPESICVRHGIRIGGYVSGPITSLTYMTAPITWPIATFLHYLLGEHCGSLYTRNGLKHLFKLHQYLGEASERLTQDEIGIMHSVLDLRHKPISYLTTPIRDVHVLCEDDILDYHTISIMINSGYSRIPVYRAADREHYTGILSTMALIDYDPKMRKMAKEISLIKLPTVQATTGCLRVLKSMQKDHAQMVLVSGLLENKSKVIGVVTKQDILGALTRNMQS